ncbi:MAG TPA: class I SAM-dependent methyltransferase [Candidatus Binatia bacterium]|nr:class I SAM-dependent methyltransferase [Candidatus Binatia bacterium]
MANPDLVKQFAGKLLNIYTGGVITQLIDIGYELGLFEASKRGPATSVELSERAGLNERYVREWLDAMTTSGIYSYNPEWRHYTLPEEHAALLTGDSAQNLCPHSRMINHFGSHLPKLVECFRAGGGIPYSAYRPVFTQCMDDVWRRIYDQHLLPGFIEVVDGLTHRLRQGLRVLDIGCGTGHAMNILAREFPSSRFYGYDIAEDAIELARTEAKKMNLTNISFDVVDVTNLPYDPKFDVITAFDAIHDQKAPDAVLRSVNQALAPDGTFLMIEFKFSSNVEENVNNPFAPMYYGFSLMHCMPVSLAVGGTGLGTVWGEQTARKLLADAGFKAVNVLDTPRPQNCIFVCKN